MEKDNLYFLNIHKNGGRLIQDKVLNKVMPSLDGIEVKTQNNGWASVTDSTYVLSAFRHPVLRTVSHYFEFKKSEGGNKFPPSITDFTRWFDANVEALTNYQLKNIFYDKPSDNHFIMDEDFKNLELPAKMSDIKSRMRRFDAMFRVDDVRNETLIGITHDILKSFNKEIVPTKLPVVEYNRNIYSREFALSLPEKIKAEIEKINEIEMGIYMTDSFFHKFVIQWSL